MVAFLSIAGPQAPLYPNPNPPTYQDSIAMLHIFIINLVRLAYVAAGSPPPPDEYEFPPGDGCEVDDGIATGVGIDAASASAKFLFKIFRSHYLAKFFPEVSVQLKLDGTPNNGLVTSMYVFPPMYIAYAATDFSYHFKTLALKPAHQASSEHCSCSLLAMVWITTAMRLWDIQVAYTLIFLDLHQQYPLSNPLF